MSEERGGRRQPERPAQASAGGVEAVAHEEPNYMAVWGGLFLLTMAEVGVAFLEFLPKVVIVWMLIGMAVWKALLVALYYMHLRFEPKRLRMMVVAPLPLVVILVVAMMMEYV